MKSPQLSILFGCPREDMQAPLPNPRRAQPKLNQISRCAESLCIILSIHSPIVQAMKLWVKIKRYFKWKYASQLENDICKITILQVSKIRNWLTFSSQNIGSSLKPEKGRRRMKRARKAQGKCESLMRNQAPEPSCIISTEWISHAKIITAKWLRDSEFENKTSVTFSPLFEQSGTP